MGGGISWNITLSLRRNRFGLGFLSIQFSKIAGIKTQREIPMNQKSNLALAVRSFGRIPEKRKRKEKLLFFHITLGSLRCTKKALEGRSLGSKKQKEELLRAELNPRPSGRLLILKSQH